MQRLPWGFSSLSAHYFVSEANKQASKQASKQACFWFLTLFDTRSKRAHSHTRKSRVRNHFNNWSINQSINQFTKTFYVGRRWINFRISYNSYCYPIKTDIVFICIKASKFRPRTSLNWFTQNSVRDWMPIKNLITQLSFIDSSAQLNPLRTRFSFGKFEIYMTKHHA